MMEKQEFKACSRTLIFTIFSVKGWGGDIFVLAIKTHTFTYEALLSYYSFME